MFNPDNHIIRTVSHNTTHRVNLMTNTDSFDARGLACPAPVLKTKELIEGKNPDLLTIIVDNEAARQNVTRFFESRHYEVNVNKNGNDFAVTGKKQGVDASAAPVLEEAGPDQAKKTLVFISADRIGRGDDELGTKLMLSFVSTLKEMGDDLWMIVFVNSGVKLTVTGSGALPALKDLAAGGVKILVCGTCLNHFSILDMKEVGETTNMLDIVMAMQLADKTVSM